MRGGPFPRGGRTGLLRAKLHFTGKSTCTHPDRERIDPSRPIKSWRSAWRAARKRAGLQLRFHDLRHTCITKLAESPASEQTLMAIAGHLSQKMIEHYSHIRMEAKRRATDAIVEGGVNQNVHQLPEGDSNAAVKSLN